MINQSKSLAVSIQQNWSQKLGAKDNNKTEFISMMIIAAEISPTASLRAWAAFSISPLGQAAGLGAVGRAGPRPRPSRTVSGSFRLRLQQGDRRGVLLRGQPLPLSAQAAAEGHPRWTPGRWPRHQGGDAARSPPRASSSRLQAASFGRQLVAIRASNRMVLPAAD